MTPSAAQEHPCVLTSTLGPVDLFKSKMQTMKVTEAGPQYKGTFDCAKQVCYSPSNTPEHLLTCYADCE